MIVFFVSLAMLIHGIEMLANHFAFGGEDFTGIFNSTDAERYIYPEGGFSELTLSLEKIRIERSV